MHRPYMTIIGVAIAVLVVVLGITSLVVFSNSGSPTAQDAFEAHLAALDAGDIDAALTYMAEDCDDYFTADAAVEATQWVDDYGSTMQEFFAVERVFDSGDQALLRVVTPIDETWQLLAKEGGAWKIRCTEGAY